MTLLKDRFECACTICELPTVDTGAVAEAIDSPADGALGESGGGNDIFVGVKEDTNDEGVVDAADDDDDDDDNGLKFCNDVASMSVVTMLRFISAIAAIT